MDLWRIWAKALGEKAFIRQSGGRQSGADTDADSRRQFHHLFFYHGKHGPPLVDEWWQSSSGLPAPT